MLIMKPHATKSTSSKSPSLPDLPPFLMPPEEDGAKIVESEFHTLFVSDEEPVLREFTAIDEGQEYMAVREVIPKHKKFTLYIEEFAHNGSQLHKVLFELRKATEHDTLELRINSNGGYVSEGIILFNTMREIFNGRTVTYNDAAGYSMGAMIFSLGDERVAYEDSSLMYHNYSTGYGGKGGELKSYVEYEDKHFDKFFSRKIISQGFLTEEEYADMKKGVDFWFDSYEMATRGICTHVVVSGFKLDNEAFIEYHDQDKPIDEWAMNVLMSMQVDVDEEAEEIEKKKKKKSAPKKKTETDKPAPKKKPAKKKTTNKKVTGSPVADSQR